MEDDDEFGDLYTDVLLPFQSSSYPAAAAALPPPTPSAAPPSLHRPIDLNLNSGDAENNIPFGASRAASSDVPPRPTNQPLVVDPQNRAGAGDYGRNSAGGDVGEKRGAEGEVNFDVGSRVSEKLPDRAFRDLSYGGGPVLGGGKGAGNGKDGDLMDKEMKFDIEEAQDGIGDMGSDPVIPGLSTGGGGGFGGGSGRNEDVSAGGGGEGDDWDSDSEDDLQIVLNDNNHGPMAERGGMAGEDDEDEDGDPLVIVADGDANQATEAPDWGEDGAQGAEMGEAGKGNGGMVIAPKVGYSSHGYHPFHSQFKYVRPNATPIPGSNAAVPGGAPGQVRPLVNIGPLAGRGRGEWRPTGQIRPPMQKGFGAPAWGAGRGLGGGLDFTLPSHKTIFEVDFDSFEEKPWKYPGIDISDFFNFGLNEESWRDYCKQLEQLRLESTMQSKIRVYESGRTEQDYDPDLPPELAAATGVVRDVAAENANTGKFDVGQNDFLKGSARMRPPLPTGRAIQVETGHGERLPSIDTRPPRVRDSDAIIEIVCQDSTDDDSSTGSEVPDQPDNNPSREDLRGRETEEDIAPAEKEYFNGRRMPFRNNMPEGDRVLPFPPGAPPRGHPRHTPVDSNGNCGSSHEERRIGGRARDRSHTPRDKRFPDNQKEESVESMDSKQSPALSSPNAVEIPEESCIDPKDAILDGDSEIEKERVDAKSTDDSFKDGNSPKKQKVSSRVDPLAQETDDGEDFKAARSSENSKARSGSSRDVDKERDGVDDEVLQDGRGIHSGGGKKPHFDENEKGLGRKGLEARQGAERNRMAPKGREDTSLGNHLHVKSEGFDRRKERDHPDGAWQRREDDPHNRRARAEDLRKKERGEEMGSRGRGKVRESDKDEHLHARKQLDNGHNRVPDDKDVSSRHRERDENLKNEYHSKRRKDEEHLRKEPNKEEILHSHRENSSSRKRERDGVGDPRKRDDQPRIRDNISDHHSDRPGRQKEEDWHRQKQSREESLSRRGRDEGRSTLRSGHVKVKDEYRGSEKEHQSKDTSRHSEQLKRRERMEDESLSNHKGRGNQLVDEERRSRQERSSSRNDRTVNVSENQRVPERKNKETTRKSKASEGGDQNNPRRHQDQSSRVDETGSKGNGEQNIQVRHSSRKHKEAASSDDERQDSKRGRSKLERWTSHKERDLSIHSKSSTSLKYKEIDANSHAGSSEAIKHPDAPAKTISAVENRHTSAEETSEQELKDATNQKPSEQELKDADKKPVDDLHLDTVEKLKKRSERFKLPMPVGKETSTTKRMESEAPPSTKIEAPAADSEIKPERPARKRRWISQ